MNAESQTIVIRLLKAMSISKKYPDGYFSKRKNITINNQKFHVSIFPSERLEKDEILSFGLFLPDHKYSRKSLSITTTGEIIEDKQGIVPDFDKVDNEPDFSKVLNFDIVEQVFKLF